MEPKNEYTLGNCRYCGLSKALKDGECAECNKKGASQMPKFITDLFDGKGLA
jgi:hypothetical protein